MLFNVTFSETFPDLLYKIAPASLTLGPSSVLFFFIAPITTRGETRSLVCVLLLPLRRWAPLDQELCSVHCSIPNVQNSAWNTGDAQYMLIKLIH